MFAALLHRLFGHAARPNAAHVEAGTTWGCLSCGRTYEVFDVSDDLSAGAGWAVVRQPDVTLAAR